MASDSDYDIFDYNSSQDPFDIDYQIDRFELRQYLKLKKSKEKLKKSSCPISLKALKSQPKLVKVNCMNDKITRQAEQKSFRSDRFLKKSKIFECDEKFHVKSTILSNPLSTYLSKQSIDVQSNVSSSSSKIFEVEHFQSFSNFRRHFYRINHRKIKSSLQDHPSIDMTDIRLAPINESVQKDFMKRLNENTSYFPDLVYHGTKLNNIESILRYGFLIPNQVHPSNSKAPTIVSANGQAFGSGIYSSHSAVYSLSYVNATNTLLGCAAIPKRDNVGKIERSHGNILVLSHVSQIIPLFLIDFKYLDTLNMNYPCFNEVKQSKIYNKNKIKKLVIISRKYLRKVLKYMNDEVRKNNRYQVRSFEFFN
ncbi:unnamed protein product [Rotaria sordida]|uniref:PARP catalytic domain-containing protein n=1 Tax=Rotaria sordida TaxID=392033 RepID=A0A814F0P9_9BILA|nr:unnamed protein product [Rotaria sordida]CAF0976417.1 unnamed protein product [Rotaria sordida]CAF1040438.1 unnamed protein product [Rotaria sordida]CAF3700506.1 unnamed protein product [Rotaria sordida]CAF3727611.1 unnamed protein product [Rotaria sordida]